MSSSTSPRWIRRVRVDVSVIAAVALGFGAVQAYPFAGAAYAAVISPNDAQSWIDGNADVPVPGSSGLYNDTLPTATVADLKWSGFPS